VTTDDDEQGGGPLAGIRVVEVAGIGPGPFCAMVLADLGADVVRVDRASEVGRAGPPLLGRGRRSVAVDLKQPEGLDVLLRLADRADVLVEGFRPGVAERLGFGPDVCLARNPALVYGRMTGWGQDGPWAPMAGHDINYIALAGVLGAVGRAGEAPVPPLNLVGDFGGGGLLLAFGVLAALAERHRSGRGQVVDAAMVEGASLLTTLVHEMVAEGGWNDARGTNTLDGGAWFYDSYETADGGWVAFGSLEPQFYALLCELLELDGAGDGDGDDLPDQWDRAAWPDMRERAAAAVRRRTRAEWEERLAGTDVCFAPVLGLSEVRSHPHHVARQSWVDVGGVPQPAPAPRFSRTPGRVRRPAPHPGEHTAEILAELGLDAPADDRPAATTTAGRGRHQRSAVAMTDDEIEVFLHGRHTMGLATQGPEGRPHLVAMWYGFVEGDLGFLTFRSSQKARNLARDPRVTCLVEDGETYDVLRGVQLRGRAERIDDEDRRVELAYDVTSRYQEPLDDAARAVVRDQIAKRLAFRIVVDDVVSWDHRRMGR
jgi:alpha-methylacyl-CoA racemase